MQSRSRDATTIETPLDIKAHVSSSSCKGFIVRIVYATAVIVMMVRISASLRWRWSWMTPKCIARARMLCGTSFSSGVNIVPGALKAVKWFDREFKHRT
jgi:hypothetical protein